MADEPNDRKPRSFWGIFLEKTKENLPDLAILLLRFLVALIIELLWRGR